MSFEQFFTHTHKYLAYLMLIFQ